MLRVPIFEILGRWVFGAFYLATGAWIVVALMAGHGRPQQPTPAAAAFMDALANSGFMDPLLAATFILGGAALLAQRTAAVGIILLAPAVVIIFLFHLSLSGQYIWGTLNLAWLCALGWAYRDRFRDLVKAKPRRDGQTGGAV